MNQVKTHTQIDSLVPTIIAEAMHTVRANALFAPGGVGERWLQVRSLEGGPGKTMDFPVAGGKVSITATEKIAMTQVTDEAVEDGPEKMAREAGRELGLAMAAKIDAHVMALFVEFGTTVGSTSVDCSYRNILDALNALSSANAPQPYLCVLHLQQWYDLLTEANSPLTATTGYSRMAEEVGYNYFVAQLYGTEVAVHPSIPLVNTNEDRSGAVLSNRALGFLWKWRPRIAYERDESLRGFDVLLSASYGVDCLDPTAGVAVVTDA